MQELDTVAHEKTKPVARKNHGHPIISRHYHGLNILHQLPLPQMLPSEPIARKAAVLF